LEVQDHLKDGLVTLVKAKFLQYFLNFKRINNTRAVLIEKIKGALKFFEVVLGQFLLNGNGGRRQ
jgi:hypothetical protein